LRVADAPRKCAAVAAKEKLILSAARIGNQLPAPGG